MNEKIGSTANYLAALLLLTFGIIYLFKNSFMPYHSEAISLDWNEVEKTQNRATIVVSGKVVKKYEENGETRIRCNIVAKDLTGSRKLDGFFIAALP